MDASLLVSEIRVLIEKVGSVMLRLNSDLRRDLDSQTVKSLGFYSALRWWCFRYLRVCVTADEGQLPSMLSCLEGVEHKEAELLCSLLKGLPTEAFEFSAVLKTEVLSNIRNCLQPSEIGFCVEELLSTRLELDTKECRLRTLENTRGRKEIGAYFTPPTLIDCILDEVLKPLIETACAFDDRTTRLASLLRLRICDPACGSGYFLVAAAQRIASAVDQYVEAGNGGTHLRSILENCIYGVDISPLSVEAARLSLELLVSSPLPSLERHVHCGNALLSVSKKVVLGGIKIDYLRTVKGRDHGPSANAVRRRHRHEIKLKSVPKKENQVSSELADLVLTSMVCPKTSELKTKCPTQAAWRAAACGTLPSELVAYISKSRKVHRFCHWEFVFSSVFAEGGFDVVLGNPPYLDSTFLKRHQPGFRHTVSQLFDTARGNWDIYVPFVELGLQILKPSGLLGMVTPNKIVASDYASGLQSLMMSKYRLVAMHDFTTTQFFHGAQVAVVVTIAQAEKSTPNGKVRCLRHTQEGNNLRLTTIEMLNRLPKGYISFPMSVEAPLSKSLMKLTNQLSDLATVSDGASTAEAYEIRNLLREGSSKNEKDTAEIKLINTGTIDPFKRLWGQKKIRYLGFKGIYPILSSKPFADQFPRRHRQSMQENVVVGGMGERLEAVVAPVGFLCGKSAVLIQPKPYICSYALALVLNLNQWSLLYRGIFGMRGLGHKCMNIGPRQLEKLPVPKPSLLKACANKKQSEAIGLPKEELLSWIGFQMHQNQSPDAEQKLMSEARRLIEEWC